MQYILAIYRSVYMREIILAHAIQLSSLNIVIWSTDVTSRYTRFYSEQKLCKFLIIFHILPK